MYDAQIEAYTHMYSRNHEFINYKEFFWFLPYIFSHLYSTLITLKSQSSFKINIHIGCLNSKKYLKYFHNFFAYTTTKKRKEKKTIKNILVCWHLFLLLTPLTPVTESSKSNTITM